MSKDEEYVRKADGEIYLEDRFENPKQCFKDIAEYCGLENLTDNNDKKLLDMGCATGESLYYYRTLNSSIQLDGLEYLQSLIDHSKDFLAKHNIEIKQGDAENMVNIPDSTYDYIVSSGVVCIFDPVSYTHLTLPTKRIV